MHGSESYPKSARIRRRREFLSLQRDGRRRHSASFVVISRPSAGGDSRPKAAEALLRLFETFILTPGAARGGIFVTLHGSGRDFAICRAARLWKTAPNGENSVGF